MARPLRRPAARFIPALSGPTPSGLARFISARGCLSAIAALVPVAAAAQETGPPAILAVLTNDVLMFPVFVGAFAFTMLASTWLIRERRSLERENKALGHAHADLKARHERLQAILAVPDQRVVVWHGSEIPQMRGALPPGTGVPRDDAAFLDFPGWMAPDSALAFQQALGRLRGRAEAFEMTLETVEGTVVEVQGRASGAYAFVRFLGLSGDRAALATLETQHARLMQRTDSLTALLQAVPFPVWLRDGGGHISWANDAYVRAVDAASTEQVCNETRELLDAIGRDALEAAPARTIATDGSERRLSHARLPATVAGDRRTLDVTRLTFAGGAAGVAVDMSEVEELHRELRRTRDGHARTLDQISEAVAIFDERRRLTFHNQAFATLFDLKDGALAGQPDHAVLLDRLRAEGKLAEHPDWGRWRQEQFAIYDADAPVEDVWRLPDGRTLRVVATPQRIGGLVITFADITEQLVLERRNKTLMKVQGETLDAISQAVAVFSADGRLRLSNPAFQKLFDLSDEQVAAATPIAALAGTIAREGRSSTSMEAFWLRCTTAITGAQERRGHEDGRMELPSGQHVDWVLLPLPDGRTMLTLDDVSDSVAVERALSERAEALAATEQLKTRFLNHVSYELRAPLTTIMGYSEFLASGAVGSLEARQVEVLGSINGASAQLHRLVNDLIDLTVIDAGRFELRAEPADLASITAAAVSAVQDRAHARRVRLALRHRTQGASAPLDAERVRRVAENLLSNALRYSPRDETVLVETFATDEAVCLRVADRGPGIAEARRATIFERFEGDDTGDGRRAAGLGLSMARALVEMHGGTIELEAGDGAEPATGASFLCRFPLSAGQAGGSADAAA